MFGLTRITSLILAFTLGFSMCLGIIGFGTMTVISKFKVRDLERYGIIAHIPDESFMTDDPVVDLLDLTMVDFVKELKFMTSLADEVDLNYVQDRYGLIFHEKLDAVLSDETRKMPLRQLFSKDGFGQILGSVYIGNIESYIVCNADGTEGTDPKAEGAYWKTKDGTKITGIEDIIADFSLNDFISGNINTNTLFDTVTIGDIFGYTKEGEDWYDTEGKKVTGVIAAFSGSTIHSVGTDINTVNIGQILGYQKNDSGEWCKADEATGELKKVTGVMSVFADSNINEIGDEIQNAQLGKLLGYTQREDGSWYKIEIDTETGEEKEVDVTGVLAAFADCKIDDVGDKLEESELGELLGYKKGEDGDWYKTEVDPDTKEEKQVKVTGAMAVFANSNINDIGDEIENTDLGKLLGYSQREDGSWYKIEIDEDTKEEKEVDVTGVLAVFADCKIDEIGDKLEEADLGELLGYRKGDDGDWYKTEIDPVTKEEREVKVTGAMAVFANSGINGIGDEIENSELGKLLGYKKGEDGNWYKTEIDPETEQEKEVKVTGAMAVFANSGINSIGDEIERTEVGQLIGYEKGEDGNWYRVDEEGNKTVVEGFVNKISSSTINNMDDAFDDLRIGDIVKAEDRTGLFAIIEPETKIEDIGSAVNDSIMNSPIQFFMNEELISFKTDDGDMAALLDLRSANDLATFYSTDEDFNTQKGYYEEIWESGVDIEGKACYTVPNWRTQPLSSSFAYIIKLLTSNPFG